jgi:hypothetical protein
VRLLGLQAVPFFPEANVVVFVHENCGTISLRTSSLRKMDAFGLNESSQPQADEPCEGCFRDLEELANCHRACVIARDRQLTLRIAEMKRRGRSS